MPPSSPLAQRHAVYAACWPDCAGASAFGCKILDLGIETLIQHEHRSMGISACICVLWVLFIRIHTSMCRGRTSCIFIPLCAVIAHQTYSCISVLWAHFIPIYTPVCCGCTSMQADANAATAERQAAEREYQQLSQALEAEQTASAAGEGWDSVFRVLCVAFICVRCHLLFSCAEPKACAQGKHMIQT